MRLGVWEILVTLCSPIVHCSCSGHNQHSLEFSCHFHYGDDLSEFRNKRIVYCMHVERATHDHPIFSVMTLIFDLQLTSGVNRCN